jgi:orotate phosphoribosyltransferase
MILDIDTAKKVATYLLQIKAIKLQPQTPFTWASGWKSPIYCDNRVSLSYPHIRTFVKEHLAKNISKQFPDVEAIAGIATAGIAQGALVAEYLNLPFAYVRPEPKKHGMGNQIEGKLEAGQKVVLIEDLISTGGSCLKAVVPVRELGCEVLGVAAIFNYGFQNAADNFAAANCPFFSLSDYENLLIAAVESGYVSENDLEVLQAWRKAPDQWGQ